MNSLERSWYSRYGWSWLLWPLSLIFRGLSALRRLAFQLGWLDAVKCPAPVIVVGNISVGGTGKTPFCVWLVQYLQQQGLKPGLISRGYGANITKPILVQTSDRPELVGDEPLLLAQLTQVPVVVCPDRVAAAAYLLAQTDCNVIISDDGLQHYRLQRDLEYVLIDGARGLGNGCLLPAGPLREGAWRLATVDLVLSNSAASPLTPHQLQLQHSSAISLQHGEKLDPAKVTLVSGIGNPERFEQTAIAAGYQVQQRRFFADHHPFTAADFADISGAVLMTAKDAVKCQHFAKADWYYLPVRAAVAESTKQLIFQQIQQLRSRYGL